MAWLDKRGRIFRAVFQIGGQTFKRSLETSDEREAAGKLAAIERRLRLVESGELPVPDGVDLPQFLLGVRQPKTTISLPSTLRLGELFRRFRAALPPSSMEANSLYTINIHLSHIERLLKTQTPVSAVSFELLQHYVNERSRAFGRRGQPLSPTTIKKELSSFSSVWSWALRMGLMTVPFPNKGLRFPKASDKPRFQTWTEIERQISSGGLSSLETESLWDCLYLRTSEINELITFVRQAQVSACLPPMLLLAAHTGARRSEITRVQKRDIDFETGTIAIRELKKSKGRRTQRVVPMTSQLERELRTWLADQPGPAAFTEDGAPLTPPQATDLLSRSLAGSRWKNVRGWHVLRHSFISNLASRSIDQRIIDEFVGHTTEAMRQRYRHLFPETKRAAIAAVFEGNS